MLLCSIKSLYNIIHALTSILNRKKWAILPLHQRKINESWYQHILLEMPTLCYANEKLDNQLFCSVGGTGMGFPFWSEMLVWLSYFWLWWVLWPLFRVKEISIKENLDRCVFDSYLGNIEKSTKFRRVTRSRVIR